MTIFYLTFNIKQVLLSLSSLHLYLRNNEEDIVILFKSAIIFYSETTSQIINFLKKHLALNLKYNSIISLKITFKGQGGREPPDAMSLRYADTSLPDLLGRLSLHYTEMSMRNTSKSTCVIQEVFLNLCIKFK